MDLEFFLGRRKLANLQKLVEQARAVDRVRPGDLNGFITQLSEFVTRAPKEPLAATQSEGDVIRIMTIHYAKGLEFPLVVVPDLNRTYRGGEKTPVFDETLGPLVPAAESSAYVGWDLHRFAEQQQEIEERKRLLYVACTRAADYLILSSSIPDLQKPGSEWLKFLGRRFDLQSGRCLDDLPAGYEPPRIRVTSEEPQNEREPAKRPRGADLAKLVEKTRQLAATGQGDIPLSIEPIAVDNQARRRFSFSRLSGNLAPTAWPATSTEAAESTASTLDPRGLGTLTHAVLERVDFAGNTDVKQLCDLLAPLHLEQDWQTAATDAAEMVNRFLAGDRAADIAQAKIVRRETEFLLPWSDQPQTFEGRYLHGFIDCLYQYSEGAWQIIDYKSNRVDAPSVPEAAQAYAMQMYVYGRACEQALGGAPVQCTLHFLRPAVEFTFHWNPDEKAALKAQLDQAIQQMLNPAGVNS
jgi:ATP-dependent helicase/nuclease subunit A